MDDAYEQPASLPERNTGDEQRDDDQQSDDGEEGPDWTKLPGITRPVIPKRGEKEFEPRLGGGSNLQVHILDHARSAMFDALRATRAISSKAVSHAVWYPKIGRAHVTLAKGIHFTSMGHSAPRPVFDEKNVERIQKRLELLPEEAIYLVERGSLFCWKDCDVELYSTGLSENLAGAPMSVQQVYAEMVGVEDLTLERLQVYTYLKRLGYAITRAKPPTSYYPTPPPWPSTSVYINSSLSVLQRILSFFPRSIFRLFDFAKRPFYWWKPLRISRWLHHDKNYASIFKSLRFLPAGHNVPLYQPDEEKQQQLKKESPYQIFYNVYKPSTPFKRSAPPLPDFQMVVVNARTTPMPTLRELTDLFDVLPELPPPLPRQRQPLKTQPPAIRQASNPASALSTSVPAGTSTPSLPPPVTTPNAAVNQTVFQRLFAWLYHPPAIPARRPHPFMALKAGKKLIIIAVVDTGNVSFFRFSQGDFTEWPMM